MEKIRFRNDFSNLLSYFRSKPLYIAGIIGALGSVLFLTTGVNADIRQGASSEQAKFLDYYATQTKDVYESYWLKCNTFSAINDKGTYETDPSCVEKKGQGGVFLWGDSHAEALSYGLRSLLETQNIPFYQKTSGSCRASLSETEINIGLSKKACDYSNKLAIESIKKINPTLIVIAQANGHEEQDWVKMSNEISSIVDSKVILVGPVSQWQPSLPKVIIKAKNWNTSDQMISDIGLDLDIINTDEIMNKRDTHDAYEYISLISKLCKKDNLKSEYYCRVRTNDKDLIQSDYGHLTKTGSSFVVNEILADRILDLYNKH